MEIVEFCLEGERPHDCLSGGFPPSMLHFESQHQERRHAMPPEGFLVNPIVPRREFSDMGYILQSVPSRSYYSYVLDVTVLMSVPVLSP